MSCVYTASIRGIFFQHFRYLLVICRIEGRVEVIVSVARSKNVDRDLTESIGKRQRESQRDSLPVSQDARLVLGGRR